MGGGDLYLKWGEHAVAQAIADEAHRLWWLQGRMPAARPLSFVTQDAQAWLLTAALPGRSGDAWLERDPALLPRIIDAFASFLVQLHALDPAECPFRADAAVRIADARRQVREGLVDEDDFDPDHEGWSAGDVLAEVERLAPIAKATCVTHGDFSLGNLILDEGMTVTGCIDVGRLGVADPYQDIAIFWQNLAEHGPAMQQRFLDAIGLRQPDADRLALHRCLDELF